MIINLVESMPTDSKNSTYRIELIDFAQKHRSKVRVMICQLSFDRVLYEKRDTKLYFVTGAFSNWEYIRRFLSIAENNKVGLLVFPELTIPSDLVDEFQRISVMNNMIIIAGSHYHRTDEGYLSLCSIVTPKGVYNTEKINPSPYEISCFRDGVGGVVSGNVVYLFHNTIIGNFAVTICLDYTDVDLKSNLNKDLDFLIVPAFNNKSQEFYYSMQTDVQRSENGLYLIYCNAISKKEPIADGKSALFALMDKCFKSEFIEKGRADSLFPNKVYELPYDKNYCVFEVDLDHKKPTSGKSLYTKPNIQVVEQDNNTTRVNDEFLRLIGVSGDNRYELIDQLYVKPQEYGEMASILETKHVLVITGDPGIGKTYTAIHLLFEYYNKGLRPTWYYGLSKGDRDLQEKELMSLEPQKNNIVYIEDPFGRTVFENRDELKTLFSNLVDRFIACKAKLIITSREEVFKTFEKEILSGDRLEEFKMELNVRHPSYSKDDLLAIAQKYINNYTRWPKPIRRIVYDGIKHEKLISPLMIYNIVRNYHQSADKSVIKQAINKARITDLVSQFADEIRILDTPAKILLYLVLLYGKKNIDRIKQMYPIVQDVLAKQMMFNGSSFLFELNGQENHRIQKIGSHIPVYRLSHPAYEEALISLFDKDATCAIICESCATNIIKADNQMSVDIFNRFVLQYPLFLERMMGDSLLADYSVFSEKDKMELNRKMVLSNHDVFRQKAQELYPISNIVSDLYIGECNTSLFGLRLRLLSLRREEVNNTQINWAEIFTATRIQSIHAHQFLYCCSMANRIDPSFISKIEKNLQETDLIKKFLLLDSNVSREGLSQILSPTKYSSLYQKMKGIIPEDMLEEGAKKKGHGFKHVLREYILNKEKPKGHVYLDEGAMQAVLRDAKIFPIGVVRVEGSFINGDVVYLTQSGKNEKSIKSIIEMSSDDLNRFMGHRSTEIFEITGEIIPTVVSRPSFRELRIPE